jgi:DNA repair photolyase
MWSLTPYEKCDFRCVYCCTRVQGAAQQRYTPEEFRDEVAARLDAVPAHELVIIGAFCDPYPPPEEAAGLTRVAIEELNRRRRRFVLVTKSTTVLRDIDLFPRSKEHCTVTISICSVRDEVLRQIDPAAPSATERFAVLRQLYDAGIDVDVNALPWIPGVTETEEIIRRVPADVPIVFAPLAMGKERDSMSLLGRRYVRDDVWIRYLEEYRRWGHVPNTSWVRPSPPPTENDPMHRLPVLDAAAPND